jgi:hypothetical protein
MPARTKLTPIQVLERLKRLEGRMGALRRVKPDGYCGCHRLAGGRDGTLPAPGDSGRFDAISINNLSAMLR